MPLPVIRALALIKRVTAEKLPSPRCAARYSAISITTAASHGHLELNAYKPVIGFALVQLADAASWSVASPATRLTRHGLPIPAETSLIAGDRLWRAVDSAGANGTCGLKTVRPGDVRAEEFDHLVQPDAPTHPS